MQLHLVVQFMLLRLQHINQAWLNLQHSGYYVKQLNFGLAGTSTLAVSCWCLRLTTTVKSVHLPLSLPLGSSSRSRLNKAPGHIR